MPVNHNISNIKLENTFVLPNYTERSNFRNFAGRPTGMDRRGGNRSFMIQIDNEEDALRMREDGWNVKTYISRATEDNPDPAPRYQLTVKVRFDNDKYATHVNMVAPNGVVTELNEDTVGMLDNARISSADLLIHPYIYPPRDGKPEGVSAYLVWGYFNIEQDEDPFAEKYGRVARDAENEEEVPF